MFVLHHQISHLQGGLYGNIDIIVLVVGRFDFINDLGQPLFHLLFTIYFIGCGKRNFLYWMKGNIKSILQ